MPIKKNIYYHLYEGDIGFTNPPVLLIHGAGGNHLFWSVELRRLPNHKVYAMDLPGHGKSSGQAIQSITEFAEQIKKWIDALGLFRVTVIGHSMGSAIAIELALKHPENVLGLGLIGAGAKLSVSPNIIEQLRTPSTYQSAVHKIITWSFSANTQQRLVEIATKRMNEIRPSVLLSDFIACNKFDEMEHIEKISQPTLILCGADDQMTPLRFSHYLADRIPNSRLAIVPGAGHMVMLEQPGVVAERITDFLQEISY
jgi:pimeloyl-ACP methyl ester carboxylesterase